MTTDIVDVKAALTEGLTELRLPTVKRIYEESARFAERDTLSYERYLLDLVTRESEDRQQKRIERLLRASRIPPEKALANFNLKRMPPKVALLTKALIEGEVLDRRENVLAFGNPGSGKTHLLCAIGQELIARGRRIYFTTSALLVQDLLVAKRDLKLSRFIKKLAHFEGLIIDDLGYVQQSREEMEVLFTLLAERYERGSVFISSNLPFSKMGRGLQRSHDDRCSHRSPRPSLRHSRAQHPELPGRTSQEGQKKNRRQTKKAVEMAGCGKQKPLPTALGKRYAFPTFPPPPPRLRSLNKKGIIVVRKREKCLTLITLWPRDNPTIADSLTLLGVSCAPCTEPLLPITLGLRQKTG